MDSDGHPACTFDQPMFAKENEFRWAYGTPDGQLPESLKDKWAAIVVENLREFDLVGITEEMPATLGLIQKRFPFLNIAQCAREVTLDEYNKKGHVYYLENLSQQHHERLEKEMELDRRLYESAHASFMENAAAKGISLKSRRCPSSLLHASK